VDDVVRKTPIVDIGEEVRHRLRGKIIGQRNVNVAQQDHAARAKDRGMGVKGADGDPHHRAGRVGILEVIRQRDRLRSGIDGHGHRRNRLVNQGWQTP